MSVLPARIGLRERRARGQAMTETVLAIPLLLLLAAGMFQFTQLFLARVRFEQACHTAARQWAAGIRRQSTMSAGVWSALGPDRRLFWRETLTVESSPTRSNLAAFQRRNGGWLSKATGWIRQAPFDFEGSRWVVGIKCRPVPLFSWLFRDGVLFSTQMAVLRYPADPGGAR